MTCCCWGTNKEPWLYNLKAFLGLELARVGGVDAISIEVLADRTAVMIDIDVLGAVASAVAIAALSVPAINTLFLYGLGPSTKPGIVEEGRY